MKSLNNLISFKLYMQLFLHFLQVKLIFFSPELNLVISNNKISLHFLHLIISFSFEVKHIEKKFSEFSSLISRNFV